jgi:hypothetical protein
MATVPTSTRQRIDISNPIITRIQVEGNDVVSFLNGTNYIRGMSQILPQSPTYISYRYDSITISQVGGEAFTFTVYTITDVGGNTFTQLTFQDSSDVVQAKTIEIYRLLVTSIFKGCCECGNTEPECSIQYTAGNGSDAGTFLYDSGSSVIRVNNFTANNQDFSGFWPIIQDGSWMFVFSKTDPTMYGVYQLSNYSDGGPGIFAQFDATLLNGPGTFPPGTELCLDVTSVGGSLVQGWQDTLDIDSVLDKDNTVDGAGFNFVFDNNESFTINSGGGFIETNATGASLNAGDQQILVTSGYIDIVTPNYATAGTGWVLALTGTGHVEYTEAGTGTISSIELLMPPAFTVSDPNPLTTNGTFTVTVDGDATQYINGLGELATLPVYTVENGLHAFGGVPGEAPPDPFLFHLGGRLREDTLIETTDGTTEFQLAVRGSVEQNTQFPFGVANLGIGGVATFQDFGSGDRPHPSVEIVGDVDLAQPLLELRMQGNLPNGTYPNSTGYLSLKYEGATANNVRSSIDFEYPDSGNNMFLAGRLTTELASNINGNERSKFDIQLIDGGNFETKLELNGTGQLTLNEYGSGTFTNSAPTDALVVDSTGLVWKKALVGGGTVTEVSATGLLTTSPDPITTTGTVTSEMDSGFLVGRYSSGTGVFEQITVGEGLTLSPAGELTADGSVPVFDGDQGIYKDTSGANDTFLLGTSLANAGTVPFQESRYITANTHSLYITGTGNTINSGVFNVTGGDYAIQGNGILRGVTGLATGGTFGSFGGWFEGFNCVYATSVEPGANAYNAVLSGGANMVGSDLYNGTALTFSDADAGSIYRAARLNRTDYSTVGPQQNFGLKIDLDYNTYPFGFPVTATSIVSKLYENGVATSKTQIEIQGLINGDTSLTPQFTILGGGTSGPAGAWVLSPGQIKFNQYAAGAIYKSSEDLSSNSGYGLGVDSNGNIWATDLGGSGPATVYDSNQGIYKDTSLTNDTFMLGAPYGFGSGIKFLEERQVDTDVHTLYIEGVISGGFVAVIQNNSDGSALYLSSPQGYALDAVTTSGRAINATADDAVSFAVFASNKLGIGTNTYSRDNYALKAVTQDGIPGLFSIGKLTSTTSVLDIIQLQATNIGLNGGVAVSTTLNSVAASNFITKWTTLNDVSQYEIQTKPTGGPLATNLAVKGTGQLQLNQYTTATAFDDDSGASIGVLNVDNLGNVFVGEGGGSSPLTTKGDLYTYDTADTRLPVGLDTQVLLADSSTPTGLRWGTNTTPPASGYYGAFLDDTTQTAVSANTAYPVKFNTTDLSNGVTVVNDGSGNPTRVTIANTGIYNVQFSLQLEKTGGAGNFTIDVWLRKNGLDIPDTAGKVVLTGSVNASPIVAAWNYLVDVAGGDYVQLMWSTTNNNAVIFAQGPVAPHPGVPSSILTVTQQAGILAGTGITAINSLTGAVQTLTTGTTGTDFAIVDSGSDHKFNLPTASATNRGALSSADWTRFDSFKTQTIGVTVDGSGGVITAGIKGYVRVPYACTITSWSIITNVTGGTLSFDIWRANNAIPTVGTPLVGGGTKPNIGGQITSSAPVGWTSTTLVANDVLAFNVEAGATVYSWAILQLTVTRT